MIQIDPKDGMPIYRQVMDQVKLLVMSGQLVPGQQLESVSSLSGRLKVNPMTISKAYGFLVEEGLVERRKGVGIFVAQGNPQQTDKQRHLILSAALSDAAALAIQLDILPEEASKIFASHLKDFSSKKGNNS